MTKEQAIAWAGGQVIGLAAKLGISHSAISKWQGTVPAIRQLQIERLSRGKLKMDDAAREEVFGEAAK